MIPYIITMLTTLPVTANGKLDRGAAPMPGPQVVAAELIAQSCGGGQATAGRVARLLLSEETG